MGWKTIIVKENSLLNLYLNNLQITYPDKRILIPLSDIDLLMIENDRIRFTPKLINKLTENKINVILCNEKRIPSTTLTGFNINSKSNEIFQNQIKWDLEFKNKCWNWIIKQKIINQLILLKEQEKEISKWNFLFNENNNNFIDNNYESQVANLFFHQSFGKDFNRQNENSINSILNYGYVILTSMVTRSLISKGLNTNISFFHGSAYSKFPLAYDVVEMFRTIVDFFVIQLFQEKIVNIDEKELNKKVKKMFLNYISNIKIIIDNKKQFLNNGIDMIIDWIIKDDFENHNVDCLKLLLENVNEE
ncbi:MAG: type II CRISPR-associated endonuclease Cas1 [Mycoplasma sp.]